ncbi:uncharacterized protein [Dermacentor albipictus]|uniref:uncharacterized protein isoform X2 n=1 Tax=Dermacentor albipictus TaxID=60249 RepID=UPI0031FCF8AA
MPANHGICENIQWYVLCCDMPEFLLPVLSMPSNILVFAGSHCAALDVRRYFILGTSATAFLGNIDVAVLVRIVYVGGSGPVSRMLRRCAVICSSARVAVVSASLVTPNGTVRKKSSRQIFRKLIATSNFKASCEPVKELAEPSTTTALPVIGRLSATTSPVEAGILPEQWQSFTCIGCALVISVSLSSPSHPDMMVFAQQCAVCVQFAKKALAERDAAAKRHTSHASRLETRP